MKWTKLIATIVACSLSVGSLAVVSPVANAVGVQCPAKSHDSSEDGLKLTEIEKQICEIRAKRDEVEEEWKNSQESEAKKKLGRQILELANQDEALDRQARELREKLEKAESEQSSENQLDLMGEGFPTAGFVGVILGLLAMGGLIAAIANNFLNIQGAVSNFVSSARGALS